jgi:large subunit ribosomal protein L9
MEILLVEDVAGVGDIGEIVSVKPGFARNFLIPNGSAIEATSGASKTIAHKMKQVVAKKKRLKLEAEKKSEDWNKTVVKVSLRVGSGGKVFGSINAKDIAEALAKQSIEIDRRRILLNEPIRKLGSFKVKVRLHAEVTSEFTLETFAAAATEEEEKSAADEARLQIEIASRKKQAVVVEEETTDSE